MTGYYDHVTTKVCSRDAHLYPGTWMIEGPIDWEGIYEYWSKIVAYCKRHHIVMGRHEEVKNDNRKNMGNRY